MQLIEILAFLAIADIVISLVGTSSQNPFLPKVSYFLHAAVAIFAILWLMQVVGLRV
jgi:hypothetical protein